MLGLSEAAVAGTALPVQQISCGVPFLFVPLATRAAVDNASMAPGRFDEFKRASKIDAHGVFLFSVAPGNDRAHVYSRMFAPEMGVVEDPATGSASGPLGCYLVKHEVIAPSKAGAMLSLQGVKMGRPSHVHISIGDEGRRDHLGARRRRIGARRRGDVVHLKRQKAEGKGQKAKIARVFRRAKELR